MVDGPLWGIGLLHRENNGAERDGVEGVEGATQRRKGRKIKEKWKWAGWLAAGCALGGELGLGKEKQVGYARGKRKRGLGLQREEAKKD
jgi:hypothetical protein